MEQKQINQNWKEFEFLDCIEKEASQNSLKINKQDFLKEGKFSIVDQGNNHIAGYTNDKTKIYSEKLPVVVFGDHTRAIKFIDFPFSLGADGIKVFVPKENIDAKYFYYALRKLKILSAGYSRHYKFLKEKKISFPVLLDGTPDLEKQKQIVMILEKAEGLNAKRKGLDELFDGYLKSVFYEMFLKEDFEKVELEKVADIERNSVSPNKIKDGDIYVGLEHIESKTGNISKRIDARNEGLKSNKFRFDSGCILYGKLRPYLCKIALPDFDGVCSTDILPIRPKKNVSNKYYLSHLLKRKNYVTKATIACTGANLPRLSPKALASFRIPLPPIELQEKFASIVEQVEKIKDKLKDEKKDADELFNALMQKAFSGELI
jgi:type I restriction enzyme, S subunit